jgi:hypothetical protein
MTALYRRQRVLGPTDSRAPSRGRHGLTRQEVAYVLDRQGGRCLLCRTDDFGAVGPVVDHDHARAALHSHLVGRGCRRCIRGIVCTGCNTMLGAAKDSAALLRAAADFLDRWNAQPGPR